MDPETFALHFKKRHPESMGDLGEINTASTELELIWRTFHRKLHELRPDLTHEHEEFTSHD
jgi:hypothetical protein